MSGHLNKPAKRDAVQRYWISSPQRIQVYSMPVERSDHGETGEAALCGFRLSDHR